jgi:hypothetical protein
MSFSTYGDLRTHFLALLNRDDCTTALADTFLAMGIKRACRGLRIPEMESSSDLVVGSDSDITIPTNFLEMKSLYYNDAVKLKKDELGDWLQRSTADGSVTDGPMWYVRKGSKWYIKPSLDAADTVTLVYYASFSFSSASDTHAVLGVAGDLLAYAALCEAGEYFIDERTDRWEARYSKLGEELNLFSSQREMTESDLVISSGTSTEF